MNLPIFDINCLVRKKLFPIAIDDLPGEIIFENSIQDVFATTRTLVPSSKRVEARGSVLRVRTANTNSQSNTMTYHKAISYRGTPL
jgi:hypothetical protein